MTPAPARDRLPIGISDFAKLREPGVLYVDKTRFVVEVLSSRREVVVVPRPRRFGKTVNLSTIRYFVEKSSEDRSALFEGLDVWRSPEARASFQKFPVIWLTLKDVKARTFDEALVLLKGEIRRAHQEHRYLLDAGTLKPEDAARFGQILRGEGPVGLYAESLRELSALLGQHHGERVFIFIDEYDSPIHAAGSPDDERRMLDFFRVFLSGGLKDNRHLEKGVLTGILRIAKESLFSGLNNPAVYSLLRSECAACFGFTEAEVRDLAEQTGAAAHLPELEAWYNGYRFGGEVIYNPWSIVNFLDSEDKVCRPYWINTSSDELLRKVILARGIGEEGEMETLIQGGSIKKRVDDRVALRDLGMNGDIVWSFLLFTGYLKAEDVRQEDTDTMATLSIPNREVLSVYRTIFRTWLQQRLGGSRDVERLLEAILAGDAATCEQLFGALLQSLSVHDLAPPRTSASSPRRMRRKIKPHSAPPPAPAEPGGGAPFDPEAALVWTPEQIYHVFVVSLLLHLQPRFTVRSNRESGGGRYDVMVMPRTPGQPAVVLELKVLRRGKRETMKGAVAAALKQIRERDYAAELRACGATPIREIAVVFDGKQVRVGVA